MEQPFATDEGTHPSQSETIFGVLSAKRQHMAGLPEQEPVANLGMSDYKEKCLTTSP